VSEPQAIVGPTTTAAIFLVATVDTGTEQQAVELLADINGLRRSVGFRVPEAGLTCVVGIGSHAWDRFFGDPKPAGLHPFQQLSGERHHAPSTPGDLLFHIRAQRLDLCFELAQLLAGRLAGWARIIDEVHGFRSFDERDLLGFVDGTENPEGEAASDAALIGEPDATFAGGSYVIIQKYLHDMDAWNDLSVEDQERAIGRTKLSDIEFPDEQKPANSHLALNTIIDENGEQQQILRLNMPFGHVGAGEYGTYYIAYARDPQVTEEMLRNMFIGNPPGNTDRILDFSTAVTGNLFFVPSNDFIDDPPPGDAASMPAAEPQTAGDEDLEAPAEQPEGSDPGADDGSLEIGSLKGKP
jgi:porphyrinogen peroxidase